MILFLDFDGVLHPNHQPGKLFTWVPRLAQWLDDWPQVDVVISSSWRVLHPQDEMVEMLGPVVGSRVVGCTPCVQQGRDDNVYPAAKTTVLNPERQAQVEAWMAASWNPERAWVALDDMAYLFEVDCARLVVCPGRQGISPENLQELDRHAEQAGLTPSQNRGPVPGIDAVRGAANEAANEAANDAVNEAANEADQAHRVQTFDKYLKHMGSCLPDALFRVTVDRARFLVTITSDEFDSSLIGWLVTKILPDERGIVAYQEDKHWVPPPAPYGLRVRIGGLAGIEFSARVVRLSSAVGGAVAVRLSEPKRLMPGDN